MTKIVVLQNINDLDNKQKILVNNLSCEQNIQPLKTITINGIVYMYFDKKFRVQVETGKYNYRITKAISSKPQNKIIGKKMR